MEHTTPKLKVLAVDDNKVNLHILQVFLQKLSHQVILAENGAEAVEKFIAERPDFILMDIMMPVMNGFEATKAIKAISQDRWVPVIFLSALNRDENLVEGLEAGGDDYMTKPINFVVLEAKLRSVQRMLSLQQNLLETLNRVRVISDGVMEAILTVDPNGQITSANTPTEQLFGWKPQELQGQSIRVLLPEIEEVNCSGQENETLHRNVEIQALRKDGSVFAAELTVTRVSLDGRLQHIKVVRDISERKQAEDKLKENAVLLQNFYDQTQTEQNLAIKLIDKQLDRAGLRDPRIKHWIKPAQNFSGDIIAAATSPRGNLYTLIADATGHGLSSAISVLPVISIFYRMVAADQSLQEIIQEINSQLKESMPIGRFVAATLTRLDKASHTAQVWVGGMPEAIVLDEKGIPVHHFKSQGLPLGIISNDDLDAEPVHFTWQDSYQLLMFSDGMIEAQNKQGQQFGIPSILHAVKGVSAASRYEALRDALAKHTGEVPESDDISLLLVDCKA